MTKSKNLGWLRIGLRSFKKDFKMAPVVNQRTIGRRPYYLEETIKIFAVLIALGLHNHLTFYCNIVSD